MGPTIVVYEDESGGWRWHLQASNGEIVAQGESHTSRADAERAARRAAELMGQAADAEWPAPIDEL